MDYARHYEMLIDRARHRTLSGYVERHHVLPRCMGGSNDTVNIVRLTPEEHYVAHQLLVKMYPGNYKLVWAALNMTATTKRHQRSNKLYGWLRRRMAEAWTPEYIAQIMAKRPVLGRPKGFKHTESTKGKMAKAAKGKAKSPEHCQALAKAKLGKKRGPQSATQRARQQAAMDTPLYKQHISEAAKRVWQDPAVKQKQSESLKKWWAARKAAARTAQTSEPIGE